MKTNRLVGQKKPQNAYFRIRIIMFVSSCVYVTACIVQLAIDFSRLLYDLKPLKKFGCGCGCSWGSGCGWSWGCGSGFGFIRTQVLTHSLAHSRTYALTHSLTHSLTRTQNFNRKTLRSGQLTGRPRLVKWWMLCWMLALATTTRSS